MRALAVASVVLLVLALVPSPAQGATVEPYTANGAGTGLLARPVGTPVGLVVVLHGYGHVAESHRGHLQDLADEGFLAVAMDFGPQGGFRLGSGAAETLAAIADLDDDVAADLPRILFSVSMGTTVAGMVLAAKPGYFDSWVVSEGLSHLTETWAAAKAVSPGIAFAQQAVADIEAECGGTPAQAPLCYQARSSVLRTPEFQGLTGAVVVHGLNDGLVPYNQGRETVAALRAIGVPTDFYTVVRGDAGAEGTTITGHATFNVDGLAGHGTESRDEHTLTGASFWLLHRVAKGELTPADREIVLDRDANTTALP